MADITVEGRAFYKAVGARIAKLRRGLGLTQSEVGDILEVSQQTVYAWEMGARRVNLASLSTLAHTLGVSVEYLLGTDNKSKSLAPKKREHSPVMQRLATLIQQLPKEHQNILSSLITAMVKQYNSR